MDIVRAALIALARAGIATVGRVPSHIDRLSQREEEKEGGRERERETERKRERERQGGLVLVCVGLYEQESVEVHYSTLHGIKLATVQVTLHAIMKPTFNHIPRPTCIMGGSNLAVSCLLVKLLVSHI